MALMSSTSTSFGRGFIQGISFVAHFVIVRLIEWKTISRDLLCLVKANIGAVQPVISDTTTPRSHKGLSSQMRTITQVVRHNAG